MSAAIQAARRGGKWPTTPVERPHPSVRYLGDLILSRCGGLQRTKMLDWVGRVRAEVMEYRHDREGG